MVGKDGTLPVKCSDFVEVGISQIAACCLLNVESDTFLPDWEKKCMKALKIPETEALADI